MSQDILHVDFLRGSKKDEFNLSLLSNFATESGGRPWSNQYKLVLNKEFYEFWGYIKERYGVDVTTQKVVSFEDIRPVAATVTQKTNGIDSKDPWTNRLDVKDENSKESIIFYPHSLGLLDEVQVEEYRIYVKSLTELNELSQSKLQEIENV